LDADGGCDSAVTARVSCAWKKFREYLPILIGIKGFSLKLKGKVYITCVMSCLMHGSETWPVMFVCLVFNGTFSTNRLYRAIEVRSIPRRGGDNTKKYHAIKQIKKLRNN